MIWPRILVGIAGQVSGRANGGGLSHDVAACDVAADLQELEYAAGSHGVLLVPHDWGIDGSLNEDDDELERGLRDAFEKFGAPGPRRNLFRDRLVGFSVA